MILTSFGLERYAKCAAKGKTGDYMISSKLREP